MVEAVQPPDEGATRRVRAALMQKVNGDEEMFALGGSIARVIELADSDEPGPHDLAYFVLSDVALTQRILRLSNTVRYRTVSGTAVTTVSRAIALLGFDNVKTTALAMLLVDTLDNGVDNGAHAGSVRVELEASLCASLVGREMAKLSFYQGAEEAAIGALFKNLGPLLVASHEHARYREIIQLTAAGKHTPAQASQMILGCSYDTLSAAVLAEWKIPDVIVRAQATLPPGPLKVAASRAEWMRQVASFSLDVARLLGKSDDPAGMPEARALLARYGAAFEFDAAALERLFTSVAEGMQGLMESMNLQPLPKEAPGSSNDSGDGLPDVLMLAALGAGEEEGTHPSGKPKNARELLLAGVQDVTQLRAGGKARVNDVILAVLETLYRALGFRFATVCLKDARAGQYRARVSFGAEQARAQAGFVFPVPAAVSATGGRDLFLLAMENDADLMISDAGSAKIRELLPIWHRALLPDAKSFIVLPLVVGKAQLGFFYADRAQAAPEGVPPDETAMIRALKRQVLSALAAG
jgi:HD-like signal output (HDOD) protein